MSEKANTYSIPSLKDTEWVALAERAYSLAESIPDAEGLSIVVNVNGESHRYSTCDEEQWSSLKKYLSDANGRHIISMALSASLSVTPGHQHKGQISFTATRNSPSATANLKVIFSQYTTGILEKTVSVQKVIDVFTPIEPIEAKLEFEQGGAAKYIKHMDERLQALSNLAMEQTSRVTESLRNQAIENQKALTSERASLLEEFDKKASELKQREDLLDDRVKNLDLTDAKASRRKLRDQLKQKLDTLAGELEFSSQTNSARNILYCVLSVALLVGSILLIQTGSALSNIEAMAYSDKVFLGIKASGGSILFGSALVYFIRWQSNWVRHRTQEELRLLRTSLDVERASWVVETLVEFKNEQIKEMPDALLSAVTRNLFAEPDKIDRVVSPVDEVADMLRSGAETVKLKFGDHEVTLDRKSLKQLSSSKPST